jgi:hypothetical protein
LEVGKSKLEVRCCTQSLSYGRRRDRSAGGQKSELR